MKKVTTGKIGLKKAGKPKTPNTGAVVRKYKTVILPKDPGTGLDDYNLDVFKLE